MKKDSEKLSFFETVLRHRFSLPEIIIAETIESLQGVDDIDFHPIKDTETKNKKIIYKSEADQ